MSSNYWDSRARLGYIYKGQKFYTITAIPYYYRRRTIILKHINAIIKNKQQICDFGCGDGEYVRILSSKHTQVGFHCVDISEEMIEEAKARNNSKNISWEVSGTGIQIDKSFDYVYSSTVFAHLSDELIQDLFRNIYNHINTNSGEGVFSIVEQTAPYRKSGKTYIRRTVGEYIELLKRVGFTDFNCVTIDFGFHRLFFERLLCRPFIRYYKKKFNNSDDFVARVRLNENKVYITLSSLFSLVHREYKDKKNRWGYCFITAYKK